MSQIVRSLRDGSLDYIQTPKLKPPPGFLVLQTRSSVISAGTERAVAKTASASLVGKARQQPERVRQVIDLASTQGVQAAYDGVQNKLSLDVPLGYANCGIVAAVGAGVDGYQIGDLVASNGGHGEECSVPTTLAALCPSGVSPTEGAFATLGAIALEGVRLAQVEIGSRVAVIGLGLIGQLASQVLLSAGCTVVGVDPDERRRKLAAEFGAIVCSPGAAAERCASAVSSGSGLDAVLVTASTPSSAPISSAAAMSRVRGRVILTGVTGLELKRSDFYAKELTFQVSCSYGPGRYDPRYEDDVRDYPIGFVRFTAARNMETFLDLLARDKVDVARLVTHRYEFGDASKAYEVVENDPEALAVVLEYPEIEVAEVEGRLPQFSQSPSTRPYRSTQPRFGIIGAGSFASGVLIPALRDGGAVISAIGSRRGVDAGTVARRHGIESTVSDSELILQDPDIDAVAITTRHDSHARLAASAIEQGKSVWVEKPLALTLDELEMLATTIAASSEPASMVVGFNRRFAPITRRMKDEVLRWHGPLSIAVTVNAGSLPVDHWTRDVSVGGGRVVGEMCHFVDLCRFLIGTEIESFSANGVPSPDGDISAHVSLRFAGGSVATIMYLVDGSQRFPKERVEVFGSGIVMVNDNFRHLKMYGSKSGDKVLGRTKQDKGHAALAALFVESCSGIGESPIPLDELFEVSRVAVEIANMLRGIQL